MVFEECSNLCGCPRLLANVFRGPQVVALFRRNTKAAMFLHAFLAIAGLGTLLIGDLGAMAPLPEDARQPMKTEPKASEPAVRDGLKVVVKPAKAMFVEKEPLVFDVTLTNTSDKSFMLFESGYFWDWKIRFGDWQLVYLPEVKRAYPPSTTLEPGKSIQTTVALDNSKDLEFHLIWKGEQLAKVPPARFLPIGKYPLVIDVKFAKDIRRERLKDYKFPHWTGVLTTNPVIVEIAPKKTSMEKRPAADQAGRGLD